MKSVEKILCDLVRIRTDNTVETNDEFVDYICNYLNQESVLYKKIPNPSGKLNNILIGINIDEFKNINTGVVLSGHMDTVSANASEWDTNPFEPIIRGGNIYGRGTTDMKHFIAVVLSLIPEMKTIKMPIFIALSCDEETDVQGVCALTSFLKLRNIHPKYALIGEATHFDLCVASRGYMGYTTIVKGVSAHSGNPALGTNAIYMISKIVAKIEELNKKYMDKGTTLNVGVIQGGVGRNSVPSEASVDWEIRFNQEEIKLQILEEMEKLYTELKQEYKNAHILLKTKEELPSFDKIENSRIVEMAKEILATPTYTIPYATEAGFFQELGMDTLICGGGDETLAHSSSEHIPINELEKYKKFLLEFLTLGEKDMNINQISQPQG